MRNLAIFSPWLKLKRMNIEGCSPTWCCSNLGGPYPVIFHHQSSSGENWPQVSMGFIHVFSDTKNSTENPRQKSTPKTLPGSAWHARSSPARSAARCQGHALIRRSAKLGAMDLVRDDWGLPSSNFRGENHETPKVVG